MFVKNSKSRKFNKFLAKLELFGLRMIPALPEVYRLPPVAFYLSIKMDSVINTSLFYFEIKTNSNKITIVTIAG